jgi:hypothetical protein
VSFKNICDKRALNQLFLYYITIDHKIELTQANSLSYSLFYRIITKKLFTIKEYLLKNLYKGFIILSSFFFASSVLFVAKLNNSLRFYIDYYKLNSLTKKISICFFWLTKRLPELLTLKSLQNLTFARLFTVFV